MDLETKTRKDFTEYVNYCKLKDEAPRQWGQDFYKHWRWLKNQK